MSLISVPQNEIDYLRTLAQKMRDLSVESVNEKKRQDWTDLNDLQKGTKPLFINHYWPVALGELFPDNFYVCTSNRGKYYEIYMKTRIFYAETLQDDNVIEPVITCPMTFSAKDYKDIERKVKWSSSDTHGETAYEIIPVIKEAQDIENLTDPELIFDRETSERDFREAQEIFEPILTVIKATQTFASKIPDEYSWLRGLEDTYTDMYDDPDWLHDALGKITENFKKRFKLFEEAGLWGAIDNSDPLGSAGLRYATGVSDYRKVKDGDFFNYKAQLKESWGFTCAEVWHCVSPDMHDEFGFEYDKQIVPMFKYMNVGCCEVLDKKIDLVKQIPNVRKVSVSEWCDVKNAAIQLKDDYVYSYRAAGVHFVPDEWDRAAAEKELRTVLSACKENNCLVEIVLNIGGSIGKNAEQKVREWSQLTRSLIDEYYP